MFNLKIILTEPIQPNKMKKFLILYIGPSGIIEIDRKAHEFNINLEEIKPIHDTEYQAENHCRLLMKVCKNSYAKLTIISVFVFF